MERKPINILGAYDLSLRYALRRCRIPEDQVSIGAPAEQRVCIEARDDGYHVYLMERGQRFDESFHKDPYEAYLKVLDLLASSDTEYEHLKQAFGDILSIFTSDQKHSKKMAIHQCKQIVKRTFGSMAATATFSAYKEKRAYSHKKKTSKHVTNSTPKVYIRAKRGSQGGK